MGSFSTFETKVVLRPPMHCRVRVASSFFIFADTCGGTEPNQTRPGLAIKEKIARCSYFEEG